MLRHYGQITAEHAIKRDALQNAIQKVASLEWQSLSPGPIGWPIDIGSVADISQLLDRLFLYANCVEKAKTLIKGLSSEY